MSTTTVERLCVGDGPYGMGCDGVIQIDSPETGVGYICDDCTMRRFGDMLTPNELRGMKPREPQWRRERDQLLTDYEQAGIGDDEDPSEVRLTVTAKPEESDRELLDRAMGEALAAHRVRMMRPGDFEQERDR